MRLLRPIVIVSPFFVLAALSAAHPAVAQTPSIFVIAASDGYGIADCLAEGGSCGRMIADAWCVAHGATRAISFGLADVATAADLAATQASPGSLVISCGP